MFSAVYYPHTTLHTDDLTALRLLKRSLLLWDRLEFIVPDPSFTPRYDDRLMAQAIELIGTAHYPSDEEKKQAHEQIEELVTRPNLPEIFYLHGAEAYDIYPEKLLPQTWELLKEAKLAVRPGPQPPGGNRMTAGHRYDGFEHYLSTTGQAGLAVMAILADCCAGTTRSRVTDRSQAYATLTGLLAQGASKSEIRDHLVDASLRASPDRELLLALKLSLIDVDALSLDQLVRFRNREAAESGHNLRDLRHRYVERIEHQVQSATTTAATKTDAEELEKQFFEESKDDIAALIEELRVEFKQTLVSKDVLVTLLAAAGSAALAIFAHQFNVPAVFTWASAPVTIGGVVSARGKFLKSRSDILRKHPMAFLYELGKAKED